MAQTILISVNGYSQQTGFGINNNSSLVISGGFGGASCSTGNTTCDNCTADFLICNKNRANPNLTFQITFQSDKVGNPLVTTLQAGNQPVAPTQSPSLNPTLTPNQPVTISIQWSALCAAITDGDTNCAQTGSAPFRVGIDANSNGNLEDDDVITFTVVVSSPTDNNFLYAWSRTTPLPISDSPAPNDPLFTSRGFTNFSVFPGDEKVFVENVSITGGSERPLTAVHFFIQKDGFTSINALNSTRIPLINGGLSENIIKGLPNGEKRYFFAASEDDAGNIGLYLRLTDESNCPRDPIAGQCRSATPSEVAGLFKDNCFIATAAYGSPMAPHVQTLREFRNQYLSTHFLGQWFIKTYYRISPPLARWISISESRRAVTRWTLAPIVFSVRAFMAAPLFCFAGFCLFCVFILLYTVNRARKTPRQQGQG